MTSQQRTQGDKSGVLMDLRANMCDRMSMMDALIATTDFICKPLDELESLLSADIENHPILEN